MEQDNSMSGGAIAGTVIGSLAALALAGLLGWCWRRERAQHIPLYSNSSTTALDPNAARAPTRTVVTEKIEPVVVKSVPTTNTNMGGPGTTSYSTTQPSGVPATNSYNTAPVNTYSSTSNPTSNPTTYNPTTTTSGYNTQPRTAGVIDSVSSGVHNPAHSAGTAVNNGVTATGNTTSSGANAVGNDVRGTTSSANNAIH
ncbi:hypothetical protein BGX23_004531 [Mortierella sp. AD031]|nr:hypothetical protein BGX23_004531 [Mortierella sp. AD031]